MTCSIILYYKCNPVHESYHVPSEELENSKYNALMSFLKNVICFGGQETFQC